MNNPGILMTSDLSSNKVITKVELPYSLDYDQLWCVANIFPLEIMLKEYLTYPRPIFLYKTITLNNHLICSKSFHSSVLPSFAFDRIFTWTDSTLPVKNYYFSQCKKELCRRRSTILVLKNSQKKKT